MTPGRHPFEELEAALLRMRGQPAAEPARPARSTARPGSGGRCSGCCPTRTRSWCWSIDQFEELFTQAPAATATRLPRRARRRRRRPARAALRVVVTLRADFYDRPLRHRGIGELLRRGTEVITPLSPEEVERAITGPAERVGVQFEPGLVAQIVADVAEHPGALPLLQYALTELFERRRGSLIDSSAYRDMGGLAAAAGPPRGEPLRRASSDGAQEATRQVLLRLVTLGEGTEDVRRRVLRQELLALGRARRSTWCSTPSAATACSASTATR